MYVDGPESAGRAGYGRPRHWRDEGMGAKQRLASFIEAIYTSYRNALTEPYRPVKTPATTEEIQEQDRYRAERYLDALRHRMPL